MTDLAIVAAALAADAVLSAGTTRPDAATRQLFAVTVIAYVPLLWRWRRPMSVFTWMLVFTIALTEPLHRGSVRGLGLDYAPVFGLLVALHAVASRCGRAKAITALGCCALPFAAHSVWSALNRVDQEIPFGVSLAAQLSFYLLLTASVWWFGRHQNAARRRAADTDRRHADELAAAQAQQAALAERAVRDERVRLARELHDIVGDGVTTMYLQAAGVRTLVPDQDEDLKASLTNIQDTGVHTMSELHRLLGLLRATSGETPDPLGPPSTMSANLEELLQSAAATGLEVTLESVGPPVDLDRSVDAAAYRILQEALTNSGKHAGHGTHVRIQLLWTPGTLTISARDRRAVDAPRQQPLALSSHFGLIGLNERVTLLGGHLTAGPEDGGFLVRAQLPTRNADSGPALPPTRVAQS